MEYETSCRCPSTRRDAPFFQHKSLPGFDKKRLSYRMAVSVCRGHSIQANPNAERSITTESALSLRRNDTRGTQAGFQVVPMGTGQDNPF